MHEPCRSGLASICLLSRIPAIGQTAQLAPGQIALADEAVIYAPYEPVAISTPRWEVSSTAALDALEAHGILARAIWP